MQLRRRTLMQGATASMASLGRAAAQTGADAIRIGLLDDMSGPYRDLTGPTGTACAWQAIREFTAANPFIEVEMLVADHQQKPDIAAGIVREWIDRSGVDVLVGVGSSAVALACNTVVSEKDKVHLNTGAASSALTGSACSPNLIHWTQDTWCAAHTIAAPTVRAGGDTWYFITADYTFGHTLQKDATAFVNEAGGRVIGSATFPFPGTTDFSSYLLQAKASGAKVVAFANAGSDFINSFKQAHEFGLGRDGTVLVGLTVFITDVLAMGLPAAQGLTMYETFYWDLNDRTRAFNARMRPSLPANVIPNMNNAGNYSAIMHYLKVAKEIGVARAKASGREMVSALKAVPTDDDCFGTALIRPDGRKIHPSYLFRVKTPEESRGPGDVLNVVATVPADQAFRPMSDGRCPMVKA